MTRLVVVAHDECVRAEIRPNRGLAVLFTGRTRSAEDFPIVQCHPTLEAHIAAIRTGDMQGLYDSMKETNG